MGFMRVVERLVAAVRGLFRARGADLQPSDILDRIYDELNRRKKVWMDNKSFVPNYYCVYLSPPDFEELSPLVGGIKDQLRKKMLERVQKKGYQLLSSSITIDLKEDGALNPGQVAVESTFVSEKAEPAKSVGLKSVPEKSRQSCELKPAAESKRSSSDTVILDARTVLSAKLAVEILDGENAGRVVELNEGEHTFGRGADATVLIKDSEGKVSRRHFKLIVRVANASILDLGSSNGTFVNGIEVHEADLKPGDVIGVGNVRLKVA